MYRVGCGAGRVNHKHICKNIRNIILNTFVLFSIYVILSPVYGINEDEMVFKDPASVLESIPESYQDPKLSSSLQEIAAGPTGDGSVPIRGINDSNQTVLVDIYLNMSLLNESLLLPHLKEIKVRHRNIIEADAYVNNISAIRDISFVSYIDIPPRLESYSIIPTCPLLNQLDINCPSEGGDGIVMVVLDNEFYTNEITNLSLPKKTVFEKTHKYTSDQTHGTACCEVIGQIAPNVKLYQIHAGDTPLQMLYSINKLEDLGEKIDIVSCSLGLNFGPGLFDIKDDLYYAIENLTTSGTVWVNSAGNEAERHWSGSFYDPDGNGYNNFTDADESINLTLKKYQAIKLTLCWNDWQDPNYGMSTQDYDLFLLKPWRDKESSKSLQKGGPNDLPVEVLNYIAERDGVYQIMIKKKNATENGTIFHLFLYPWYAHPDEYVVSASSLNAVAGFQNVLTVGAFNNSSGEVEAYSSRGPASAGIIKPDLVAPTNIQTSSTYPGIFDGTSAAAPVVAGCVALALERNNLENITAILMSNCKIISQNLPNNTCGSGLVNLKFLSS